jgi:hypothetical protein
LRATHTKLGSLKKELSDFDNVEELEIEKYHQRRQLDLKVGELNEKTEESALCQMEVELTELEQKVRREAEEVEFMLCEFAHFAYYSFAHWNCRFLFTPTTARPMTKNQVL